jgi:hypothetical protein
MVMSLADTFGQSNPATNVLVCCQDVHAGVCAAARYLLPDIAGWEQDEVYKRGNEEAMEVRLAPAATVATTTLSAATSTAMMIGLSQASIVCLYLCQYSASGAFSYLGHFATSSARRVACIA